MSLFSKSAFRVRPVSITTNLGFGIITAALVISAVLFLSFGTSRSSAQTGETQKAHKLDLISAAVPTSTCLTDTAQSDFQTGVVNNTEFISNPGDVKLADSSSESTDQVSNPAALSTTNNLSATTWTGQTFRAGVTGNLTKITVGLGLASGTSGTITVEIRDINGTNPGTAVLATGTMGPVTNVGSAALYTTTFATPAPVVAGTSYSVVLRTSVGNTVFGVRGSTAGGSTLANGQVFTTTNSGAIWTGIAADLYFTTFVTPPATYFAAGDFVSGLKDSNPANGTATSWGTLAWNAVTPAGTAILFQAAGSNDSSGQFNFVGPDGTASTFFTNGGSLNRFDGFRYLKYKALFSTTNTALTPRLNDVTLCFDNKIVTTLTVAPAAGVTGGTVNLSATLTGLSAGLSGQTVNFTLNGNSVGSAVTDASGVASLNTVSLTGISAGIYPTGVGAAYAATGTYTASNSTAVLTVYALPTIAKAFGPESILTGGTSTVTLTLTNPAAVGALTNASFTDTLTSMSAVGGAAGGTCAGASSNMISAGATALSFTGITIPDNGNCTVTFDVTSNTVGSHPNQTSGVTTTQTPSAGLASNSVSLTVLGAAVWTGASDTNWNSAANWNPAVPTASNDAVIPSGTLPNEPSILSAGTDVTVASLNVQTGRTLTIETGRVLNVTGILTNSGTINNAGGISFGSLSSNGTVSFTGTSQQTIPAGIFSSVTINNTSGTVLGGDVSIGGTLTLTSGNITTNANTLTIGPSGSVSRTSGYIIGNLRKTFGAVPLARDQRVEAAPSAVFIYPVGTANGFSPVTINALTGSGSFTVSATQTFLAGTDVNNSIQRYWSLTSGGITSADITFQYLDADVPAGATEGNFRFIRKSGAAYTSSAPSGSDTAANTFTLNGVAVFSDWTLGNLTVTAASVQVSGQVRDTGGASIGKALVTITSADGVTHRAITNPFGYYIFTDIPAGAAYVINVEHKRYSFSPRVLSVADAVDDIDFIGSPLE